jgi:hypothetical protein
MAIFFEQYETVDNKDPVTYYFFRFIESPGIKAIPVTIFTSDADEPPCRQDDSTRRLCRIICNIDGLWDKLAQVPSSDGTEVLRKADNMKLTMRFDGEPKWTFTVGERMVEKEVRVLFTEN